MLNINCVNMWLATILNSLLSEVLNHILWDAFCGQSNFKLISWKLSGKSLGIRYAKYILAFVILSIYPYIHKIQTHAHMTTESWSTFTGWCGTGQAVCNKIPHSAPTKPNALFQKTTFNHIWSSQDRFVTVKYHSKTSKSCCRYTHLSLTLWRQWQISVIIPKPNSLSRLEGHLLS